MTGLGGPPLDEDIEALLRGDPDTPVPSEALASVRARLAGVVPALRESGVQPGGDPGEVTTRGDASPPDAPGPSSVLARVLAPRPSLPVALAGLCAGTALGVAVHAALVRPAVEVRTVYIERDRPAAPAPLPSLPATPPPAVVAAPPSASPKHAPRTAPAPAVAPLAAEDSVETLAAERALLDKARSALTHGDAALATSLLDEHAHAFPRARLGEEREALAVEALAIAGRSDDARAALARFRALHPKSLFLSALDSAVDGR
jgi:hypothetical protein